MTRLVLLALAAVVICPPAAFAQTTGALRGQVVDRDGASLAGVAVAVESASLGLTGRGATTDAAGAYVIASLPPAADYVVLISFPGFATVRLTDLEIRPGLATIVPVTLVPETAVLQRIEVRARPQIVTLEETTTQTRFGAEYIDALPLLGRNYQDILALAPGVSDTDGDGNPNIHGARDTDMITLVDGVSTTDPLTGKIGAQLNIESIQEIEVKTSGATAEFSRAQGGFANIVTKSGGNDFRGTFKFHWRGSLLDGDGAGAEDPRLHGGLGERGLRDLRFNDFLPFLSVEGPIVRDHAWFFSAHEYVSTQDPVNAVNAAFVTGLREWREFIKLTWEAGPNHRLALSLNYDPQTFLNQGLSSFIREESGFTQKQGGLVLTLKAVTILSPLLALESALSGYDERPARVPSTDPDTNRNGAIGFDRNGDGFFAAAERDGGEDYDGDGRFDVFESDLNRNGQIDPTEDLDHDGRFTQAGRGDLGGGCEGAQREDLDCDGRLDNVDEDLNHNGRLDIGEDLDGDDHFDRGLEDRNGNQRLDDTPFPSGLYPYGELAPLPADRAYTVDQRTRVTSGPYYEDFSDRRRRVTLREDLSIHVPDFRGSHDVKAGFVFERESFNRDTTSRMILAPFIPNRRDPRPATVRSLMPTEGEFENRASSLTAGLYLQETYKPFPNVSLALGLRFDRERLESFGYTPFDPAAERTLFNRIIALAGDEGGKDDFLEGDNDGVHSYGIRSDPIFAGEPVGVAGATVVQLRTAALSRLTRHHIETPFQLSQLGTLYTGLVDGGIVDYTELARLGISPQRREPFALTNNNLAPRVALSWDPASAGKSKLFATWGRYFDRLFLNTVVGEEGPDFINGYYLLDKDGVTGSGTPDAGVGAMISRSPPSTTQVSRGLETPFSDELTLGFEREIAPEMAISLTYVNRKFRRQLQDIDVNHTLRFEPGSSTPRDDFGIVAPLQGSLPSVGSQSSDGRPDLYVQNFFFNQVLRVGNFNEARYQAVELELLRRLSRRWQLQGSYTWSRAVGSAEDFQSRLGNDPSTVQSEFGYLDYDQRHVVKLNAMLYLPQDWQLGVSASWASGLPYSVVSRFFALDNVGYQQYRTLYGQTVTGLDGAQRFESLRRNSFRNPSTYDINLRLRRSFVLGRTVGAMFLEIFNLLNTDDLRIFTYEPLPASTFDPGSPTAGIPVQLDAQRRFGRRFQLGFQVEF